MRQAIGAYGCGVVGVVGAVAVIALMGVGWFAFRVATAELRGRGEAHIQIQSGENRIAQYEKFFDLCVSVQNAEAAIDAESARLTTTTDPTTMARIETNLSALHTTRMRGINTYNADARKDYTDGQFLASNLPYQLSTEPYSPQGAKTKCAA